MRSFALFSVLLVACGGSATVDPDGGAPDGGGEVDACTPATCPDDPCEATICPDARHRCVVDEGEASCRCPAGTTPDGDRCVDDAACVETTCGPEGACSMEAGEVRCECPAAYAGLRCERCADGFARNHQDRCVADLCAPSPCDDPDRSRCVVADGRARCACNAGTHEEDGRCVPDVTCTPESCSGRGTCAEDGEGISCECATGHAGRFCDLCDDAAGYHPDGEGGCTDEVCRPNPCSAPFSRCVEGAEAICECPLGSHPVGETCAPDEVCTDTSCSGRGACSVDGGVVRCACDEGWDGATCAACAPGYHDDGAGECTDDPCRPSPCTSPRGVCTRTGAVASCGCDAGYHEDGVGGCTTDPCLPHPCGEQACRTSGGAAECYTPVCDDGNPCTDDTPTAMGCVFSPRANGTECSTSVCVAGQVCAAGTCGGGTPVVCNDGNPCTADTCDAVTGCRHDVDPGLVPDDGVACTVGSCASGAPVFTPSDAACDDGLYCTGVERCQPSAAGADARGCVRSDVPTPPGPSSPCAYYATCDEATGGFPLVRRPMGAPCDDGIACTSADVCQSEGGACAGTLSASCAGLECTSTVPWSPVIDIPSAWVSGALTLDGGAIPELVPNNGYGTATIWAVSRETGIRHRLAALRHTSFVSSTGSYRLVSGDATYETLLVPGVYDLLYDRQSSVNNDGSGDRWVGMVTGGALMPSGWRVLRENVVIGAGASTLNVDIPSAVVSGTLTLDGGAIPELVPNNGYGTATVWAVSRETGVRHRLAQIRHTSFVSSTGSYRLVSGDGTYETLLVPGTYDLLYDRQSSVNNNGSGDRWVGMVTGGALLPSGWRVLRENVVIGAGASTLNVDIPSAVVSGTLTLDGGAIPELVPNNGYGTATVWAVSRETGVRHRLAQLRHTSFVSSTGSYRLVSGDGTYETLLVPGAYDLLYDRQSSVNNDGSGDRWVGMVTGGALMPSGWRVLRENVVIGAGASTLNVDIPSAVVSGTLTLDGGAIPELVPNNGYGTATVWAVSRETGVRHRLAQLRHTSFVSSTGSYRLVSGDGTFETLLVPGTYDLLYDRQSSVNNDGSGDRWVGMVTGGALMPSGWRVLRENVVIGAGASTLNVDIPSAVVSGTLTLDGGAIPELVPNNGYGTATVWAVSRETGVRHRLAQLRHTSFVSSTGSYRLVSGDGTYETLLVPGAYDLLYERQSTVNNDGSGDRWVGMVSGSALMPSGWRVLRENVVIGAGASAVNVDIPSTVDAGGLTLAGEPVPTLVPNNGYGTATIWAVSRQTGVRHRLAQLRHTSFVSSTGSYRLVSGDETYETLLVPGVYDLLYDRQSTVNNRGSGDRWVGKVTPGALMPSGWRLLRQCVEVL